MYIIIVVSIKSTYRKGLTSVCRRFISKTVESRILRTDLVNVLFMLKVYDCRREGHVTSPVLPLVYRFPVPYPVFSVRVFPNSIIGLYSLEMRYYDCR